MPKKKLTERTLGTGKRLTLTEKILVKAEKGVKSVRKTAELYGISTDTVQRIWKNKELAKLNDKVATVKKAMTDNLYLAAHCGIGQVVKAMPKANAQQAAVATGIMLEKARLLEEKSTQNLSHNGYLNIVNHVDYQPTAE